MHFLLGSIFVMTLWKCTASLRYVVISFDLYVIFLLNLVSLLCHKEHLSFPNHQRRRSQNSWNGWCGSHPMEGHGETRGQVFRTSDCPHGRGCWSCRRGCGNGQWIIQWQWQLSCHKFQDLFGGVIRNVSLPIMKMILILILKYMQLVFLVCIVLHSWIIWDFGHCAW